jgi:N-acetylneuraminic acid mutarotase
MKKKVVLFVAILAYCTAYSQNNFNPFGGAGRTGAVSFVINDTVYVGLGNDGDTYYKDFWKYSSESDQWLQIADFPGDARAYSQAFSVNGKGYVGLGKYYVWNTADTTFQDIYSYDPATDLWTKLNDFGGGPRTDAVCFVVENEAYIGTGNNENGVSQKDFWKYDHIEDTWTQLTSEFSGDIRRSASAFSLNNKAYVVGGSYFSGNVVQLSDVQEYDPHTDTWTEKIFADGLNLSFNNATAFGYGGKGYICYGNKDNIVSYNPVTNNVENLGNLLSLEDMRMNPISFILNNTAYFGLGLYAHDDGSAFGVSTYDNTIYKLDLPQPVAPSDITISNDTIVEYLPDNSLVGYFITTDEDENSIHTYELVDTEDYPDNASFSISDSLLLASSMNYAIQNTFIIRVRTTNNSNGLYYEKEFTILVKEENIPPGIDPFKGEAREGAVQFTIGDTVYVGLGRNADYVACNDFWKYSHATDRWERIKPFPGGIRTSSVAFTIDGIGYVGMGYGNDYSNMKKDFYSYNPATNTWTQIADFGGAARSGATAFVIDGAAYIGAGEESNDQLKDFWKYDPKTNNWTEISIFSGGKRSGASSFVLNGKGYVVGGYHTVSAKITPYADVHEYNPLTGNWIEKIDYDYNLSNSYDATALVHKNKAYICYGANKNIVVYDTLTNVFKSLGNLLSLEYSITKPVSFVINDSAYFGLGNVNYLYCEDDIYRIEFPENPTDILLSDSTIIENEPDNTLVGYLSVIDKSINASHTFELFDNENYPDNAAFTINGTSLSSKPMDYEIQNSYIIRIKATNNYELSLVKEFEILVKKDTAITSIKTYETENYGYSIFPNPSDLELNIVPLDSKIKIGRVEIFSIRGQKVLETKNYPKIDISNITPGIYLIVITTEKHMHTEQIIIE